MRTFEIDKRKLFRIISETTSEMFRLPKHVPFEHEGRLGWKFSLMAKPYAVALDGKASVWIPRFPKAFQSKEGTFVQVDDAEQAKAYIYISYDDREEAKLCWSCILEAISYIRGQEPKTIRGRQLEFSFYD